MHNDDIANPTDHIRDPQIEALSADWKDHLRAHERREAEHHDALDQHRVAHDSTVSRKRRQANLLEDIETDRLGSLRRLRSELDMQLLAAQDLAGKALANLGIEYRPEKTRFADILKALALPEAEAAKRAGVPIALTVNDRFLKFLKIAGMIGCLLLGMVGMGALVLHVQPTSLFHSFMLPVAMGLALILVGGTYLVVSPTSRRAGALKACDPEALATKLAVSGACWLVALMCVVVALVDAKAITAINSARALVNPDAVPSFFVTLLVGLALSAAYVMGTSILAFSDGFGFEARKKIEAEQAKHLNEERNFIEVTQACEALNDIEVIEDRRTKLTAEIKDAEQEYRASLARIVRDLPVPPEMPDEHRRDIRLHHQRARFAGQKLTAYELLMAKLTPKGSESNQGGRP
jgi:hypothetical protein